jgi:voltage-gated potassium channel
VSPNVSGALRMASMLVRPSVVSFLDVATRSSGMDLRIEQAAILEGSSLDGKTLEEAAIPQATGLIVIAVKRAAGTTAHPFTFNPSAALRLSHGDELIVLGTPDQISKLRDYIAGGSDYL